jgi:GNAT superfamily N-acetyltransferase
MLTIRTLNPHDAEAFVTYLADMDFQHAPQWAGCFCRFYATDCSMEAWTRRDPQQNRTETIEAIRQGTMKGLLALDGERIIGWLNANRVEAYPRLNGFVEPYVTTQATGALVCFVIHPDYRGQGVATRLMHEALGVFKAQGITDVLSFPFENPDHPQRAYHGSLSMHQKAGFTLIESRGQHHVVRVKL